MDVGTVMTLGFEDTSNFPDPVNTGGSGKVTVNSGGLIKIGGQLTVGGTTGESGTLIVNAGGQVRNVGPAVTDRYLLNVGSDAASLPLTAATGTVTVSGEGALIDMGANGIVVGSAGTGALTVSGGGTVRSATANSVDLAALAVGRLATGSGDVSVTGVGSFIYANGLAYIGRVGTGRATVSNGGQSRQEKAGDSLIVGHGASATEPNRFGGTGILTVSTGGSAISAGDIKIGQSGSIGRVTLQTSGLLSAATRIAIGTGNLASGASGSLEIFAGAAATTSGAHIAGSSGVVLGQNSGTTGTARSRPACCEPGATACWSARAGLARLTSRRAAR